MTGIAIIGSQHVMALAAFCAANPEVVIITEDHTSRVFERRINTEPPAPPPLPSEYVYLVSNSSEMYEPEEKREPPRRRKHWQKHDRLPFYAGVKSRKHRR